jgi:drug/metabolite transporter (DMT)-like permease
VADDLPFPKFEGGIDLVVDDTTGCSKGVPRVPVSASGVVVRRHVAEHDLQILALRTQHVPHRLDLGSVEIGEHRIREVDRGAVAHCHRRSISRLERGVELLDQLLVRVHSESPCSAALRILPDVNLRRVRGEEAPYNSAMSSEATENEKVLPKTSVGTHQDAFGPSEWGLLSGVALIWGSSFVFMAIGLDAFNPGVVTLARVCLGALTLALVPKARAGIDRQDRARVFVLGIIWIGIPLMIFPIAQQWIDSSVAGMLNGAVPITSAVFATIFLRRLPGWRQLLGIGIGFVGIVAISAPELVDSSATALGSLLVVGAVVLYGLSTNLAVPLQQKYGALPVLFKAQLAALVIVVPFGLIQIPGSTWAWSSALAMVPLGVLGTGVAFVLMATLVGRVGGPRGSVAIYFVPIVAIILGVVVRDDAIAPMAIAGAALVLLGAWITSRKES